MAKAITNLPCLISGSFGGVMFKVRNGQQFIEMKHGKRTTPPTAREKISRERFRATAEIARVLLEDEELVNTINKEALSKRCSTAKSYIAKRVYKYLRENDLPDVGARILPGEYPHIDINRQLIATIRDYIYSDHPKY